MSRIDITTTLDIAAGIIAGIALYYGLVSRVTATQLERLARVVTGGLKRRDEELSRFAHSAGQEAGNLRRRTEQLEDRIADLEDRLTDLEGDSQ